MCVCGPECGAVDGVSMYGGVQRVCLWARIFDEDGRIVVRW